MAAAVLDGARGPGDGVSSFVRAQRPDIAALPLHDALPICITGVEAGERPQASVVRHRGVVAGGQRAAAVLVDEDGDAVEPAVALRRAVAVEVGGARV